MASKSEIQAQIEALTAEMESADDGDDFEIEVWTGDGNGARVPYSKGRKWLQDNFGIDLDPAPTAEPNDPNDPGKPTGKGKSGQPAPRTPAPQKYFGKRSAPGK